MKMLKIFSIFFLLIITLPSIPLHSDNKKSSIYGVGLLTREEEQNEYCSRIRDKRLLTLRKEDLKKILDDTLDIKFVGIGRGVDIKNPEAVENSRKLSLRQDAKLAILCSDKISEEEKLDILLEDSYNLCVKNPEKIYLGSELSLWNVFLDNKKVINRLVEEIDNKKYKINKCYMKNIIISLGFLKFGGKDIGNMLIEIFDKDESNVFRVEALDIFASKYSDYYTKEEMMPYIKKLMNEPYFSICKVCDVVPKKECLGKMKSYPFRDALVPLLKKYNIKFEYIQLDECMLRGVPVLTE